MPFKILTIENFGGGQSDSDYEATVGQFFASQDFDIFTDEKVLTPNLAMTNDNAGLVSVSSDIRGYASYGDDIYAIGNIDAGAKNELFKKSTIAGNWGSAVVEGAGSGGGGIKCYGNELFYYYTSNTLSKYNVDTAGNTSSFQTGMSAVAPYPMYVHPPSNEIYFGCRNSAHAYDGTTFTPSALLLPGGYRIQGFTSWDKWVVVAAINPNTLNTSKLFLWDTYNTMPEYAYNVAINNILAIANVNGVIVGVCAPDDIYFIEWRGGENVYITKKIKTTATTDFNPIGGYNVYKGKLYVALGGNKGYNQGVYVYKPHQSNPNQASLTLDRTIHSSDITNNSAVSMQDVYWHGDASVSSMFLAFQDKNGLSYSNRIGTTYATPTSFQTIIYEPFPGQASQPVRMSMEYKPLPASAALSAFTKVDNASTWKYIGANATSGSVKCDFYDTSGYAFDIGNYHQFKISSVEKAELLKLIVKFKDAERR